MRTALISELGARNGMFVVLVDGKKTGIWGLGLRGTHSLLSISGGFAIGWRYPINQAVGTE